MYTFNELKKEHFPRKFVTLSFDDSVMQDLRFARMLDKYGLRATFNLNSGQFGQKDRLFYGSDGKSVDHSGMPRELIRKAYDNHELAVHTLHHPSLCDCDEETVIREIEDDRTAIEELSCQTVLGMAYPGVEKYNDATVDIIRRNTPLIYARDGIETYGFSLPSDLYRWHPTCHYRYERLNSLFEDFIALDSESDELFFIVGHSYEFDIFNEWDRIESILKTIFKAVASRGVICATSGEIATYITKNKEWS